METKNSHQDIKNIITEISKVKPKQKFLPKFWKHRFENFCLYWPLAWIDLLESIIWILTLGQWKPSWSFYYISWVTTRAIKKNAD